MKKIACIVLLLSGMLTIAQVSEKELDQVSFVAMDDGQGGMLYGFSMNEKLIGPNYNIKGDGTKTYNYFSIEGLANGFQMFEVPTTGEMTLLEKKDNQSHGNAFKMVGSELAWAQTYKNDVLDKVVEVAFTSNSSNRVNCRGNCINGFGMLQTEGGQMILGYFNKSQPTTPVIHIFKSNSMYQGAMNKWDREGFGKYTYANDGSYYIGMWKKNKREGLGMWFNSDGSLKSKGYYKKDDLIKNM